MNNAKIDEVFGFTKKEIKKMKNKGLEEFNKKYIEKITGFRNNLRIIQMKALSNTRTLETKYMLPVNLFRLTQDYSNHKENFELKPQEIDEAIEELLNCYDTKLIPGLKPTDTFLISDDRLLKYLFEIAIHEFLCS